MLPSRRELNFNKIAFSKHDGKKYQKTFPKSMIFEAENSIKSRKDSEPKRIRSRTRLWSSSETVSGGSWEGFGSVLGGFGGGFGRVWCDLGRQLEGLGRIW